jgi:hypothetical protein
MPEERGLFLGESWRLHPSIRSYTSELFYEGKLSSESKSCGSGYLRSEPVCRRGSRK